MSGAGTAPRMTFNGIWPTMLVKRQLPGFEEPTAGLAAYILELEGREADRREARDALRGSERAILMPSARASTPCGTLAMRARNSAGIDMPGTSLWRNSAFR